MNMGILERWITGRRIKQFIADPNSMMTVNPLFCEHDFINGICRHCGIDKETWTKESPYNI